MVPIRRFLLVCTTVLSIWLSHRRHYVSIQTQMLDAFFFYMDCQTNACGPRF